MRSPRTEPASATGFRSSCSPTAAKEALGSSDWGHDHNSDPTNEQREAEVCEWEHTMLREVLRLRRMVWSTWPKLMMDPWAGAGFVFKKPPQLNL